LVESTARRRAETAAQARQSAREREQDLRRGVARTSDNVITRSELPGAAQGSTLPGGLGSQPRTGIGSSRENQARTVERTFGPRTELPPGAPTMRTGAAEHATSGHSGAQVYGFHLVRSPLVVADTVGNGLAHEAGLMAGDQIIAANGHPISSPQELAKVLREDRVQLQIRRGTQELTIDMAAGEPRETAPQLDEFGQPMR